jgi:hypothetical protein
MSDRDSDSMRGERGGDVTTWLGDRLPGVLGKYPKVTVLWGLALLWGLGGMLLFVNDRSLLMVFVPALVIVNLSTAWFYVRFGRS